MLETITQNGSGMANALFETGLGTLVKNVRMVAYYTNQILKITVFWDMRTTNLTYSNKVLSEFYQYPYTFQDKFNHATLFLYRSQY